MSAWVGSIANMVEVDWVTSLSEETPSRYEIQEAPHKRWAFVSTPPFARKRSWDIDFMAWNRGSSVLAAFAGGLPGDGVFRFVSEYAAYTNVLTPSQASLWGIANGGVLETTTGLSSASLVGGASTVVADNVPVIPGKPVTVSVDAAGSTFLYVDFKTATGSVVMTSYVRATNLLMQKLSKTFEEAPSTARYITVRVSGYNALANPQVTWTDKPVPYSEGNGADSVVITDSSRKPVFLNACSYDSLREMSAKIVEVG